MVKLNPPSFKYNQVQAKSIVNRLELWNVVPIKHKLLDRLMGIFDCLSASELPK